jgi:hypothetical protein
MTSWSLWPVIGGAGGSQGGSPELLAGLGKLGAVQMN